MKIKVQGTEITLISKKEEDYISLTDIARYKNNHEPKDVVKNWLRSKATIEFLGLWERINNPHFKGVEFDSFIRNAGNNYFVLSPMRWVKSTNAKGIISRPGRGGGTFAHKDIALEFVSWISAEFKLYFIKEFQRLKEEENERKGLGWDLKRNLVKINYRIHTNAIKNNLIPPKISKSNEKKIYASEADVLNVALFGTTATEWRSKNQNKEGNMRDYADVSQLVCLANLEALNSVLIKEGISQHNRLTKLNEVAISQMKILVKNKSVQKIEKRK